VLLLEAPATRRVRRVPGERDSGSARADQDPGAERVEYAISIRQAKLEPCKPVQRELGEELGKRGMRWWESGRIWRNPTKLQN